MRLILLIIISVIATCIIPVFAEDVKPDPREKLGTAIPEGIRLLEAKKYKAFIKSFVNPEQLKKFTDKKSLEEFAKTFGERKSQNMIKVLKMIKGTKPNLNDTGTKATFLLKESIAEEKSITFIKIKKRWYIQN